MEERQLSTKISIEDIIKYPFEICNDFQYSLDDIIQEFQIDEYNFDYQKMDTSLFLVKNIYNNPHDSDEQSYRKLLFFKNKPCCIFGYTGDRGTSYVDFFNKEIAKELYEYFLTLSINQPYDKVSILPQTVDLSDRYSILVQDSIDKDIYCHISNPKWSYVFGTNMKNLCYMDETTQLIVPVEFVEWVGGKKQSYEETPEEQKIVYRRNGVKFTAGYESFLIKCKGNEETTI